MNANVNSYTPNCVHLSLNYYCCYCLLQIAHDCSIWWIHSNGLHVEKSNANLLHHQRTVLVGIHSDYSFGYLLEYTDIVQLHISKYRFIISLKLLTISSKSVHRHFNTHRKIRYLVHCCNYWTHYFELADWLMSHCSNYILRSKFMFFFNLKKKTA